MPLSIFARPKIPNVPFRNSLGKKSSSGKFLCSLLESQRLRPKKQRLLPAVAKVSVAAKVGSVETLVAVEDGDVDVADVEVVAAVT
jgi:hypothetical protein